MIGIDISRCKRWVYKLHEYNGSTDPDYQTSGYRVEITYFLVYQTDHVGGIDANFTATVYDTSDNSIVAVFEKCYRRLHYGGWEVVDRSSATLTEAEPGSEVPTEQEPVSEENNGGVE